ENGPTPVTFDEPEFEPESLSTPQLLDLGVDTESSEEQDRAAATAHSLQTIHLLSSEVVGSRRPSPFTLPSPPITINPFMDDTTLSMIRHWRDDVQSNAASKEDFWGPGNGSETNQKTKRRAASPNWLRTKFSKRRKLERTDSSGDGSPSRTA